MLKSLDKSYLNVFWKFKVYNSKLATLSKWVICFFHLSKCLEKCYFHVYFKLMSQRHLLTWSFILFHVEEMYICVCSTCYLICPSWGLLHALFNNQWRCFSMWVDDCPKLVGCFSCYPHKEGECHHDDQENYKLTKEMCLWTSFP